MDSEIREKGCVSALSRLNSNKELAAEIVIAIKAENKVWLFVQGKRQETMYARRIYTLKTNKQVIAVFF